jgi:hypothetical protein
MCAIVAALTSLAFVSPAAAGVPRDVRWIIGPASIELGEGRIRCDVPSGVALASGPSAQSILEVVSGGRDGSELAVVSPIASVRSWFVVLAWQGALRAEAPQRGAGGARDGQVVWLERPRLEERTGRVTWAFAGPTREGPIVNQHVQIPARGGAVLVTLVAPVEELAEARVQLGRIVEGLGVRPPVSSEAGRPAGGAK